MWDEVCSTDMRSLLGRGEVYSDKNNRREYLSPAPAVSMPSSLHVGVIYFDFIESGSTLSSLPSTFVVYHG